MEGKQQRVCIVGTGMAGLVTAYLLHNDPQSRFRVHVLEIGSHPSLDSASVSVPNARTKFDERIDVPMRAFTGGYYHNMKAMYDYLGVNYRVQPFLFHFAKVAESGAGGLHFVHASNNHRMPPIKPPSMSRLRYLCELCFLLVCYLWFTACCLLVPAKPATASRPCESLDEYLSRIRIPRAFVNFYLLPLISAITTCSHEALLNFPANDVVEYKKLITTGKQYVVSDGVNTVQKRLMKGILIKYSCKVTAVEPEGDEVKVTWTSSDTEEKAVLSTERFDNVIFAVPPDVVAQAFTPLRTTLSQLPTTPVNTVVHTDLTSIEDMKVLEKQTYLNTIMGNTKESAGQSQNIYLRTTTKGEGWTEAIHLHACGAMVTSSPFTSIDRDKVISSSQFTRVLRTPAGRQIVKDLFEYEPIAAAQGGKDLKWRNGDDGVWLVGSWCWDGMVLLEGCVVSAVRVVRALGGDIPWHRSAAVRP